MEGSLQPSEVVVLTTHERSSFYTTVLGADIDLRFDPLEQGSLEDLLHNIKLSGCRLVVIDECYFISADDMALGLESFVENEPPSNRFKVILVCSKRKDGDPLLAYLATYCRFNNIIYDVSGVGLSLALSEAVKKESSHREVLHLAKMARWEHMKKFFETKIPASSEKEEKASVTLSAPSPFKKVFYIRIGPLPLIKCSFCLELA